MNLDDYEKKYFSTYESFAETVRFILEKALLAADTLPQPQSIQCRAKGLDSLRRRLTEANKLATQTLELERRDLAGARLIFYTNNDVERFLASRLVRDNFEIEEELTRIHHPTPENEGAQYRGIHYTVRLRDDRKRLPEYARFAGLRCEIQVQTVLNHAWSETSHDILYKDNLGDGYGKKAMDGIARRFDRIMKEYLVPAGFEIQKAQKEYEQLRHGKALYDQDIGKLLDKAQNNNERYEILSGLKDHVLPNHDDLPKAYDELKGPLLRAVRAARVTDPVPIETTYGMMEGFKSDLVTRLVIETVERLRYVDPVGSLQLLIDIYLEEPNEDRRQQIVNVVKQLAEYNLDVYQRVGPQIQALLLDHLAIMRPAELDRVRPVALAVWTEAIQSDITGTRWTADSVQLRMGAVPASDDLKAVREKALKALFEAYDRSPDDRQKRAVLSALDAATRTPNQGQYSNELLATILKDATRIVDFMTSRAQSTSYEVLQHLEYQLLYDFHRAKDLVDDPEKRFNCQREAQVLVDAILQFRDTINADAQFVHYKVLVGFESVYPMQWASKEIDLTKTDEYRRSEAERLLDEITTANETKWFGLITRCAQTKSDDLATFPFFGRFIDQLAERKPEIAYRFLNQAADDLRKFLAGFLTGLGHSARRDLYEESLAQELKSARNLAGVARHARYSDTAPVELSEQVLRGAITAEDISAVTECLLLALERYGSDKLPSADEYVRDALTFLDARNQTGWVYQAWFLEKNKTFFDLLTAERAAQLLHNLENVLQIDFQVDRILSRIAACHLEAVWDYFGRRLDRKKDGDEDARRFEAVPFKFHGLEKSLSKDPGLALRKGADWFAKNPRLFQYRGGRLLSNAFPDCSPDFAAALADLVKTGSDADSKFALAILQNYKGEAALHPVLKEIVARHADDDKMMVSVKISIESTGVVSGELGFADAWRERKESLMPWLEDERQAVREFATRHIAELDQQIADEHRRAEAAREMRKRDYEQSEGDGEEENT